MNIKAWAVKVHDESMKNGKETGKEKEGKEDNRGRKRSRMDEDEEEGMEEGKRKKMGLDLISNWSPEEDNDLTDENPKFLQSNWKQARGPKENGKHSISK